MFSKLTTFPNIHWAVLIFVLLFWISWFVPQCYCFTHICFFFPLGCGSTTVWDREDPPGELKVALAFGLAAATLVQCVGHISGAHLNPAVTIAMLVTRNVTVLRAVCYSLAQLIGGIVGAGILYGVTPREVHGSLGVTKLHPHIGLGQAFGVEFMTTFIVVFTVFANLEPKRSDMGSRSLAIGLSIVLGHLFAVGNPLSLFIMFTCTHILLRQNTFLDLNQWLQIHNFYFNEEAHFYVWSLIYT